ncbi:hypothetical protein CALVIDRAFT_333778 [Calocera viscosa TUFC12733]|uniref:Uncharacterized protein n=1 Tax=Calocera viscosa (strain TUFC12733) TaxID=1330018 RepID=A0A167HLR6_CALVF|nr:hypothetical protein CALVIDRAFT_333778 [Calocera viscosa TUFC12733]
MAWSLAAPAADRANNGCASWLQMNRLVYVLSGATFVVPLAAQLTPGSSPHLLRVGMSYPNFNNGLRQLDRPDGTTVHAI